MYNYQTIPRRNKKDKIYLQLQNQLAEKESALKAARKGKRDDEVASSIPRKLLNVSFLES